MSEPKTNINAPIQGQVADRMAHKSSGRNRIMVVEIMQSCGLEPTDPGHEPPQPWVGVPTMAWEKDGWDATSRRQVAEQILNYLFPSVIADFISIDPDREEVVLTEFSFSTLNPPSLNKFSNRISPGERLDYHGAFSFTFPDHDGDGHIEFDGVLEQYLGDTQKFHQKFEFDLKYLTIRT